MAATRARRDRCRSAPARRRSAGAGARRGASPPRRVEHGERAVARAAGEARPFGAQEVALMAAATSPATGQRYGVKRVCAIWGVARSSCYDARRQQGRPQQSPAGRRGPKPRHSDDDLLAAIRHDLARSPWAGEGHRKVWARLQVIDGIRVGRSRVLRIMGENSLLSPHRRPPRPANDHDGSITTEAPNVMWGADVIPTVKD